MGAVPCKSQGFNQPTPLWWDAPRWTCLLIATFRDETFHFLGCPRVQPDRDCRGSLVVPINIASFCRPWATNGTNQHAKTIKDRYLHLSSTRHRLNPWYMRAHRAMTSRLGRWAGFRVLRVLTSESPGILWELHGTHPMKSYVNSQASMMLDAQTGFTTVSPQFDHFESEGFGIFQSHGFHDGSLGCRGPGTLDANQDALVHRSPGQGGWWMSGSGSSWSEDELGWFWAVLSWSRIIFKTPVEQTWRRIRR